MSHQHISKVALKMMIFQVLFSRIQTAHKPTSALNLGHSTGNSNITTQTDPKSYRKGCQHASLVFSTVSILLQALVKILHVDLLYRVLLSTLVLEHLLAK